MVAKKQTSAKSKKTATAAITSKEIVTIKKETADLVLQKVQHFQKHGELDLPPNYSAANALKSAWLILQNTVDKDKRPALQVCSKESIAHSLLDMVIQGLNPAKKQCYFIVYGQQLTLQRSYFGTKAVCFQVDKSIGDIFAEVVYEGDQLEYRIERGLRIIENHTQKLENIDDQKVIAAYAVSVDSDGKVLRSELMTIDQLKKAWAQSKMYPIDDKGNIKPTSTHGKFTGEMAKKTVTARMAKHIINTSSDENLVLQAVRRTDDETAIAEADAETAEFANTETIDIKAEPAKEIESVKDELAESDEMSDEEKAEILAEEQEEAANHVAAGKDPGF